MRQKKIICVSSYSIVHLRNISKSICTVIAGPHPQPHRPPFPQLRSDELLHLTTTGDTKTVGILLLLKLFLYN